MFKEHSGQQFVGLGQATRDGTSAFKVERCNTGTQLLAQVHCELQLHDGQRRLLLCQRQLAKTEQHLAFVVARRQLPCYCQALGVVPRRACVFAQDHTRAAQAFERAREFKPRMGAALQGHRLLQQRHGLSGALHAHQ